MPTMQELTAQPNLPGMVSKIIPAIPGVVRAFHVFTPALMHRMKNPNVTLPVMALRSSIQNFEAMMMYQQIEALGPSVMREMFDKPLPGTGGRGLAIMFTEFPIRVWYSEHFQSKPIATHDGRTPDEILQDVLEMYTEVEF